MDRSTQMKALVMLAMVSGCSFALVTGPTGPPERTDRCTTTHAAPIVDAVVGTAGVIIGLRAISVFASSAVSGEATVLPVLLGLGILPTIAGIAYLASSAYGNSRVSRCLERGKTVTAQTRHDEIVRKRMQARTLTKVALTAARDADCYSVRQIDSQVLALDPVFHRDFFLADVGVTRCLAPAARPPPVPPVQP